MSSRSGVRSSPSMSMGTTFKIAFALSTPMSMERNKAEKAAGSIQLLKEDERADQHQKAVRKRHRAAEVKEDGSGADGNAGELVDNELRQHIKNRRDFHGKGRFPRLLHGPVYLRCGSAGQVKILDLGDALHIFQHLGDQAARLRCTSAGQGSALPAAWRR